MHIYINALLYSTTVNVTSSSSGRTTMNREYKNITPLLALHSLFVSATPWFVMNSNVTFSAQTYDALYLLAQSPTYHLTRELHLEYVKDRHFLIPHQNCGDNEEKHNTENDDDEKTQQEFCIFFFLPSLGRNLRKLEMRYCNQITCFHEDRIVETFSKFINVEEFIMTGAYTITDEALAFLQFMPYLKYLELSNAIEITDNFALEYLLKGNIGLKEFHTLILNDCDLIGNGTLRFIQEKCSQTIEVVSIALATKVTDFGLECWVDAPRLRVFNCPQASAITNIGLGFFGDTIAFSENLEQLNFAGLKISDEGISQLVNATSKNERGFAKLNYLNLRFCINLTDKSIFYFGQEALFPALETLILSRTKIQDSGVEFLAGSRALTHQTLKHLELGKCDLLSNKCGEHLIKFKKLECLDLEDCVGISEEFFNDYYLRQPEGSFENLQTIRITPKFCNTGSPGMEIAKQMRLKFQVIMQ